MGKEDSYNVDEKPFCPLLSIAAGKTRPCAGDKCTFWCEQFNYRYSACALTTISRNTSTMSIVMKNSSGDSDRRQ